MVRLQPYSSEGQAAMGTFVAKYGTAGIPSIDMCLLVEVRRSFEISAQDHSYFQSLFISSIKFPTKLETVKPGLRR